MKGNPVNSIVPLLITKMLFVYLCRQKTSGLQKFTMKFIECILTRKFALFSDAIYCVAIDPHLFLLVPPAQTVFLCAHCSFLPTVPLCPLFLCAHYSCVLIVIINYFISRIRLTIQQESKYRPSFYSNFNCLIIFSKQRNRKCPNSTYYEKRIKFDNKRLCCYIKYDFTWPFL